MTQFPVGAAEDERETLSDEKRGETHEKAVKNEKTGDAGWGDNRIKAIRPDGSGLFLRARRAVPIAFAVSDLSGYTSGENSQWQEFRSARL